MVASSTRPTRRAMAQTTGRSWRQRASAAMGIALPSRPGSGADRLDRGRVAQRLEHRAVALRALHEPLEVLLARAGRVDLEAQPDRVEAGPDLAVDPERPAQVEVALDDHLDALGLEAHRGRDHLARELRARGQRAEQQVARAGARPRPADPGMGLGLVDRPAEVDR